jgi:chromosome segregation ATPase
MALLLDQRRAQEAKRLQDNARLVEGAQVADDVDRLRRLRSVQEQQGKLMAAAIAKERSEADAELAKIRHEVEAARAEHQSYEASLDARDRELNQRQARVDELHEVLRVRDFETAGLYNQSKRTLQDAEHERQIAEANRLASEAKLAQAQAQEAESRQNLEESMHQSEVLTQAREAHARHVLAQQKELDNREGTLEAREASIAAQEAEVGKQRAKVASDQQVLMNARKLFNQH